MKIQNTLWIAYACCFVYSSCGASGQGQPQAVSPSAAVSTGSGVVATDAPGWMWSHMVACSDPLNAASTGRAGGPGSYAIYSFTGTGIEVHGLRGQYVLAAGQNHPLGTLQVSIDGHVRTTVAINDANSNGSDLLFSETDFTSGVHVLKLESEEGWVAVDFLKVTTGPPAGQTLTALPGRVGIVDNMANYSLMFARSNNWNLDSSNSQYMNGVASRAVRTVDDREFIVYRCPGLCKFDVHIYTKSSYDILRKALQLSVSSDNGITLIPVDYVVVSSGDGGSGGGWTGYELAPAHALPAGAKDLIIVVNPKTGQAYDPEIASVTVNTAL